MHMETLSAAVTVCSICGESLNAKGECLACLLRGGLDEPAEKAVSFDSLGFGDFEIARREDGSFWELGCGAMGVTYRATDKLLHRTVALKVIEVPASAGDSRAVRERFLREARAAAALRHPNVAGVFQFGAPPDINRCFYAMELVEGETLEARVRRDGPLDVEMALEIAIQVTRALMAATSHGLVHRDLKPGNIMLTCGDAAELEVKVIDFGLAKATADAAADMDLTHGGFVGTPTFASPEQFRSEPVDARSDIYSLGVTLWYALIGRPPFSGRTIEELCDCQARADLPVKQLVARKIPAPVIKLLRSTLAVDPAQRPASARELMEALGSCRRKLAHRGGIRSSHKLIALIVLVTMVAAALLATRLSRQKAAPPVSNNAGPAAPMLAPLPEKSIAVLPFENLSAEKSDAFFADGIQDDVLTSLATIKELKVISRTSVMAYRDAGARNTRQIGQTLGVANVLEGSVRRVGDRVAVNVQLIDTRTDRHLWAKHYDRTLTDSLGLQGELAKEIAAALGATLSPQEKAAVQAKPTNNPAAYDAYLRGRAFAGGSQLDRSNVEGLMTSYQEAVKLDPSFALAWAYLSWAQSNIYWQFDSDPARLAAAKDALDRALALDPNLPETHLALGYYRYYGQRDFTRALAEFQKAEQDLPNNVDVIRAIALIQRRLGHWDEAIAGLRRAVELDPRNIDVSVNLAVTNRCLRRFPEVLVTADGVLAWEPTNANALWMKALAFWARGDLKAVEPLLANPGTKPPMRGVQALFQRRYAAAIQILSKALVDKPFEEAMFEDRTWLRFTLGVSQQRAGNVAAARATYQQAVQDIRRELEKVAPGHSYREAELHEYLGLAYAGLGEAASAIAEGQKAIAADPTSKDPFEGPEKEEAMAQIYALLGDADHAIPILKGLLQTPYGGGRIPYAGAITPALLQIEPFWDQIRNDPRFQELAAEKKP
jgi:serine/threonine protein kinase